MAKGKKEKTIRVHMISRESVTEKPLRMYFETYERAVDCAHEGDEIYSGDLALQGKLRRVVE